MTVAIDIVKALVDTIMPLFKQGKPLDDLTVGYPGGLFNRNSPHWGNKMAIKVGEMITLRII